MSTIETKSDQNQFGRWRPERGVIREMKGQVPWAPTPIRQTDPQIRRQQQFVRDQADDIFNNHVPAFISPEFLEFMKLSYYTREATRSAKNMASFSLRLIEPSDITEPSKIDTVNRMYIGQATPNHVFEGAEILQLAATEVAKLGHYFGFRLEEHQEDMRADVKNTISERGGVVYENPKETFEILLPDTGVTHLDRLSIGIMMARRIDFARIGQFNVFERSSFNVRLDEGSNIEKSVVTKLKRLDLRALSKPAGDKKPLWIHVAMQTTHLEASVKELLAQNDYESIPPQSTTIVAHSPEILAEVKRRQPLLGQASEHVIEAREYAARSLSAHYE